MDKQALRRIRASFIAIPLLIAILSLIAAAHVRSVASTYDLRLEDPQFRNMELTQDQISIQPDQMARVRGVQVDESGCPHLEIEGLKPANGQILINAPSGGMAMSLTVNAPNLVLADGVNFTGWRAVVGVVLAAFVLSALLCFRATRTLFKCAWYGYEMIAYVSGAIFCTVESLSLFDAMFIGDHREFIDFAILFTQLANDYLRLTILPMGILATLVCISNISLVVHEGMRPVNLLGIACSILWILALIIPPILRAAAIDLFGLEASGIVGICDSIASIAIAYVVTLLFSCCICAWLASRHKPSMPRDTLIILGCGIRADGTPTPLLKGRVDAALAYAREAQGSGFPAPTFVPSGGKGADECISEAESMAGYLKECGIEDSRILIEDRSGSTQQNMAYSQKIIQAAGRLDRPIGFATTNYHVFRGYVWAHKANMAAEGIAAPTRAYFWPNAFLREFAGIVFARKFEILFSLIIICSLYFTAEYAILLA